MNSCLSRDDLKKLKQPHIEKVWPIIFICNKHCFLQSPEGHCNVSSYTIMCTYMGYNSYIVDYEGFFFIWFYSYCIILARVAELDLLQSAQVTRTSQGHTWLQTTIHTLTLILWPWVIGVAFISFIRSCMYFEYTEKNYTNSCSENMQNWDHLGLHMFLLTMFYVMWPTWGKPLYHSIRLSFKYHGKLSNSIYLIWKFNSWVHQLVSH